MSRSTETKLTFTDCRGWRQDHSQLYQPDNPKKKENYDNYLYSPSQKTKKTDSSFEASVDQMSSYGVVGNSLTCLISAQSLTLNEMLGNGAFGYVRRGKWAKDSRKKVS